MALPLNRIELCGNVATDIVKSKTKGGEECVKFSLAVDRPKASDLAEEGRQSADFFPCEIYGSKMVESIIKNVRNGDQLWIIEGVFHRDIVSVDSDTGVRHNIYDKVIIKKWSVVTSDREREREYER